MVMMIGFVSSEAQGELGIGQWEAHLPYQLAHQVELGDNKAYYATEQSILIIDLEDDSYRFLSKVDGLSEAGVREILYDEVSDQLIIAYASSVVDIVQGSEVLRVSDIADKADIQGDKLIYDMHVQDQLLYLATGFGLVEFDLESLEFGFTLDISTRVNSVDGAEGRLVIATEDGAYRLDLSSTNVPAFFEEWEKLERGLPEGDVADVYMVDNRTMLAIGSALYVSEDTMAFSLLYDASPMEMLFVQAAPQGYMTGERLPDNAQGGQVAVFDTEDNFLFSDASCNDKMLDAAIAPDGRLVLADQWLTLRHKDINNSDECRNFNINSPFESEVSDITIKRGKLYMASGGVTENFFNSTSRAGFYVLEEDFWTNINESVEGELREFLDLNQIESDPFSDKIYMGSFWSGLMEYDTEDDSYVLYDKDNSSLQGQVGDPNRTRISGLDFDDEGNLWISNFSAERPISVMTQDGEWQAFDVRTASDTKVTELVVDEQGFIWVAIWGTSGGVFVMDPGESATDPSDDRQRFFNASNSELNSNFIYDLAVDNDGAVWVGTGVGAVVFDCGGSVFEQDICVGNRRRATQDSIQAYLLESEDVLCVETDGADRKWFGTRNGIFVQGPSGEDKVDAFDESNSPLLDNTVLDIFFEPEEGIMYIATARGLQSIRTETTGANRRHGPDVFAFPNPVTPEYEGPIAIKGLAQDAEIRITDLDGNLVYKTEALGGQAIWNGQTLEGRRAAGGVYLVFSSTNDFFGDIDTYVTKIMMIR